MELFDFFLYLLDCSSFNYFFYHLGRSLSPVVQFWGQKHFYSYMLNLGLNVDMAKIRFYRQTKSELPINY